jgi:hypothetical protein
MVTPSFRIIDFGRGERFESYLAKAIGSTKEEQRNIAEHKFANECIMENGRVRNFLNMPLV